MLDHGWTVGVEMDNQMVIRLDRYNSKLGVDFHLANFRQYAAPHVAPCY